MVHQRPKFSSYLSIMISISFLILYFEMEQRRETGNLIPIAQRSMGSTSTPFGSAPTQSYFGGGSSGAALSSPRKMQQTHQMLFGNIQPVSFKFY